MTRYMSLFFCAYTLVVMCSCHITKHIVRAVEKEVDSVSVDRVVHENNYVNVSKRGGIDSGESNSVTIYFADNTKLSTVIGSHEEPMYSSGVDDFYGSAMAGSKHGKPLISYGDTVNRKPRRLGKHIGTLKGIVLNGDADVTKIEIRNTTFLRRDSMLHNEWLQHSLDSMREHVRIDKEKASENIDKEVKTYNWTIYGVVAGIFALIGIIVYVGYRLNRIRL